MINEELYRQAKALGACKEGLAAIPYSSERELVEAYKRYIDFSIDKCFPGEDFIQERFSADVLHGCGVYVRERVSLGDCRGVTVLNSCSGEIAVTGFSVATVYVRGKSDVSVRCGGMCKVHVYAYDDSCVRVRREGSAHVFCISHGNSILESDGEVTVRKKP